MENKKCTNCETENPINFRYCSSCGYELPKINTEELLNTNTQPVREKTKPGKLLLRALVFALAFGLSYVAVQQIFFRTPTFDKNMMAIASEINKSCPLMVDAETRLDNAIALPKNIFQYNYTLVNVEKETADTAKMKNYLEPTITNLVKTNPQMKFHRDMKTTMNYFYKDKTGKFLFLISITPDKYE
jgi:hypothetical protein